MKISTNASVSIALLVVLISACKKDDNNKTADSTNTTNTNNQLASSELSSPPPGDLKPYAKEDVQSYISDNFDNFQVSDPIDFQNGLGLKEDESCDILFDNQVVSATADAVTGNFSVDVASCIKGEVSEEGVTINSAILGFYFKMGCQGVDLSSYNGKKFSELMASPMEECTTVQSVVTNAKTKSSITLKTQGTTLNVVSDSIQAHSTSTNGACTVTFTGDQAAVGAGCMDISKTTTTLNGSTEGVEQEYTKSVFNNIKYSTAENTTWYSSGTLDVTINGWVGVVTYNGEAAPTYTFSKGGETVTGTITAEATVPQRAKLALKNSVMSIVKASRQLKLVK